MGLKLNRENKSCTLYQLSQTGAPLSEVLSVFFKNLLIMCLDMDFFGLILLEFAQLLTS